MEKPDLIYIANTRIPSKKANTYQSLCVCESLSEFFNTLELWHPSRPGDYLSNKISTSNEVKIASVFKEYGIKQSFQLRRFFSIDIPWLSKISIKVWFYLQALSFFVSYFLALQKESSDKIIFTRDLANLFVLAVSKKMGLIKQKVFYEAHCYSPFQNQYSKMLDGVVVINHHLKSLYDPDGNRNILVAHDAVKQSELVISSQPNIKLTKNKSILYSGNLMAWKGVYTLADSAKYLGSNCKVIFLGGSEEASPEFNDYVSKLSQNHQIELLGFKPKSEVRGYLDIADVLVLPNSSKYPWSYATSPLKLFEYMAARKPIVASRLPSLQEILRDGENAILFNPDDPKDLAEKITWVLENDCSKIVEQAWQDVQEYTWEKRAERIVTLMKEIGAFDKYSCH